jgi:hypothetical protein
MREALGAAGSVFWEPASMRSAVPFIDGGVAPGGGGVPTFEAHNALDMMADCASQEGLRLEAAKRDYAAAMDARRAAIREDKEAALRAAAEGAVGNAGLSKRASPRLQGCACFGSASRRRVVFAGAQAA